jgi:hypothetical protein
MSRPALDAVTSRIASIRQRVDDVSGRVGVRPGFAQVLLAADQRISAGGAAPAPERAGNAPVASRAVGASPATPLGFEIIGMLGTPIVRRGDLGLELAGGPPHGGGDWKSALPARGIPWAGAIEDAANRAGVDPRLLAALVWGESEFTPDAVSHSGAIGLTQLMPATAAGLGVDPTDPIQNLDGGARFLASMIRQFGSLELGLAAYNAGPGAVRRAGGIPSIPQTQAYVPKVLGYYYSLGGAR